MANGLYAAAKKKFLDQDAGMDLLADTIKVTLIDVADYTVNLSTHDFYDDAVAGQVSVATLGTKTTTAGTFDSADVTFSAVNGDPSEALVIWSDTAGGNSTDPLIAYIDTFGGGMPVTPNGGNILVTVHASGWFSI